MCWTPNKSHYKLHAGNLYVEVNVCNAVIRPLSMRLYGAETCDAGQSGWDTDTIHPVKTHCTINRILKLLFKGKNLHTIAVHSPNRGNRRVSRRLRRQHSDIASPSCYERLEPTLRRSLTSIIQSGLDSGALCCPSTRHNTVTHCTW